jgi:DNA-binding MarR family transcriptional regulator
MTGAHDGRCSRRDGPAPGRSVLVQVTADGRRLETARITNSAAQLRRQIARAGEHPQMVFEATYGWVRYEGA